MYRVRYFIISIVPVELYFLFFHFYDSFLSFKPETIYLDHFLLFHIISAFLNFQLLH